MGILETTFQLTPKDVLKHMHMREDNRYVAGIVEELLSIARPIARPKALYKVSYVENRDGNSLTIGGIVFTSHLLRVNLEGVERVFPYIATCGRELDSVTLPGSDFMKTYTLDIIKELALRSAVNHLETHLKNHFAISKLSRMNPGSLPAWPITDQSRLFAIFGDVAALIRVRLTENSLMIPIKSSSGIFFPTEVNFESCRLCSRSGCPGRRASYDPDAARKYGENAQTGQQNSP